MRKLFTGWNKLLAVDGLLQSGRLSNRSEEITRATRPLRMESLEDRRMLALLTVNTAVDQLTFNNSTLSLREAIAIVNNGGTQGLTLSQAEWNQISTGGGNAFGTNDRIVFQTGISQIQLADQPEPAIDELRITRSMIVQ